MGKQVTPNILWLYNKDEQKYADHVPTAIENSGGNPIALDYYKRIDLRELDKKYAAKFLKENEDVVRAHLPQIISDPEKHHLF